MVSGLRELAEALEAGGAPRHNGVRRRLDGQLVVDAWPRGLEALLWGGFRGETWVQPGREATQVRASSGAVAGACMWRGRAVLGTPAQTGESPSALCRARSCGSRTARAALRLCWERATRWAGW